MQSKQPGWVAMAKVFVNIFAKKFVNKSGLAHFPDTVASSGRRELRAVKIPASYDAWRTAKRPKNEIKKSDNFLSMNFGVVPVVRESWERPSESGTRRMARKLFLFAPFRLFVTFFPFLLRIAVCLADGKSKGEGGSPEGAGAYPVH